MNDLLIQMIAMRNQFNDQLVSSIMNALLSNEAMQEIAQTIMYICTVIGLFQIFRRFSMDKIVKFALTFVFVLAVVDPMKLGGEFPLSGSERLHLWAYRTLKTEFDKYANQFDAEKEFAQNINNLTKVIDNMALANDKCDLSSANGNQCWISYINTGVYTGDLNSTDTTVATNNADTDVTKLIYSTITAIKRAFTNPASFIFPLLLAILAIISNAVSLFVLLGLGLVTAVSLMMAMVLTPFALIGKQSAVKNMYRKALSATLFTFVSKFIIWVSNVFVVAIDTATRTVILKQVTALAAGGATVKELELLINSNFLAVIVVLIGQVYAITKISNIAGMMTSLSLESLVSIGEMLMTSATGLLGGIGQSIGTMATGAAGVGIGYTAGLISGNGGNGGLGGTNGPKSSLNSSGNSSGGDNTPTGGEAYRTSMGTEPFTDSDSSSTIAFNPNYQAAKSLPLKKSFLEKTKQKVQENRGNFAKGFENVANMGVSGIGFAANTYSDLMRSGLDGSDPLKTIKGGMQKANDVFHENVNYDSGRKLADNTTRIVGQGFERVKNRFSKNNTDSSNPDLYLSQRLQLQKNLESSKMSLNDESKAKISKQMDLVGKGIADDRTMQEVLRSKNMYQFDDALSDKYSGLMKNEEFKNLYVQNEKDNELILKNIAKEVNGNGEISQPSLVQLNSQIISGLLGIELAQSIKNENGVNLNEIITKQNQNELMEKIDLFDEKAKSKGLTSAERRSLLSLYEKNKNLLAGDKDKLTKIDKIYNNSLETKALKLTDSDIQEFIDNNKNNEYKHFFMDVNGNPDNRIEINISNGLLNFIVRDDHHGSGQGYVINADNKSEIDQIKNKNIKEKVNQFSYVYKNYNNRLEKNKAKSTQDGLNSPMTQE